MARAGGFRKGRKRVNSVRREVDGYKFASTLEHDRYLHLKRLEEAGLIKGLEVHPRYPIVQGQVTRYRDTGREIRITLDFRYFDLRESEVVQVIEDTKGYATSEARLRIAVFESSYGVEVQIVTRANQ